MGCALRSTDGGSHFSHLAVPPNPSESIDSVLPVSDSEAVFEVPDFDTLLLTRDGGEHFSTVLRSQALYASFLIAFVNANDVAIAREPVILGRHRPRPHVDVADHQRWVLLAADRSSPGGLDLIGCGNPLDSGRVR